MTIPYTSADWSALAPLTIVAVTALVMLLADLVAPKNVNRMLAIGIAIAGLVAAGVVVARASTDTISPPSAVRSSSAASASRLRRSC